MKTKNNIDASGLEKRVIQSIKKQVHITLQNQGDLKLDKTPVIVGEAEYFVASEPLDNRTMDQEEPPYCASSICSQYSQQIHRICHDQSWPPGRLILVCSPDTGECCYCSCK
ncbi:MAG: hypothetical protein EHM93_15315 [Bacteroidales bacterium]|nr:MAG: hypothetical protein EHM93_15315 [Bacteroidales bacterium]